MLSTRARADGVRLVALRHLRRLRRFDGTDRKGTMTGTYLTAVADWPSSRRAATHLATWLDQAEEVRQALGGRAARRFLGLLYTAEGARLTDFVRREDNHRAAAARYLEVARAKNGAVAV